MKKPPSHGRGRRLRKTEIERKKDLTNVALFDFSNILTQINKFVN